MKKLFFTLIFIAGLAVVSFGQNATAKKKGIAASASTSAADKQAAAQAQTQTEAANDLDPATLVGAANGAQAKTGATGKYDKAKAKAKAKATSAIKAHN
jgi:hypothetical protein